MVSYHSYIRIRGAGSDGGLPTIADEFEWRRCYLKQQKMRGGKTAFGRAKKKGNESVSACIYFCVSLRPLTKHENAALGLETTQKCVELRAGDLIEMRMKRNRDWEVRTCAVLHECVWE